VVEYLINQNAKINEENINGKTSMTLASERGRIDVLKYLMSKGADSK